MRQSVLLLLLCVLLISVSSGCDTTPDPRDNRPTAPAGKDGAKDGTPAGGKGMPGTGGPNTGPNRPTN
jgi:hypothetical protein